MVGIASLHLGCLDHELCYALALFKAHELLVDHECAIFENLQGATIGHHPTIVTIEVVLDERILHIVLVAQAWIGHVRRALLEEVKVYLILLEQLRCIFWIDLLILKGDSLACSLVLCDTINIFRVGVELLLRILKRPDSIKLFVHFGTSNLKLEFNPWKVLFEQFFDESDVRIKLSSHLG